MQTEIGSTITQKIGFTSHQNAVPVLRELTLTNTGECNLEGVTLSLSADPPVLEPKTWQIDSFVANSTLHIADREVKLRGGLLADLTESITGEITFPLMQVDVLLTEKSHPLEILAKNHWGGCGSMPELLATFCMPNDPAVDRVLKAASDVLRRAGKPAGIDGYESKSRSRVWELASAIWSAVARLGLSYALPPASFERVGQKIRTPSTIFDGRIAICLDTALLFAAALEQARLNPLIILTEGHAFVGLWLQPQEFSDLITDEAAAVRKRIELHELVVFETTLITSSPVPAFSQATENAKQQLTDEAFQMALDIRRARMRSLRPLALPGASPQTEETPVTLPPNEALEEAPPLPAFDVEVPTEATQPADRISLRQRKLLDLTARNRLLHLPESSKFVPLLCSDPDGSQGMERRAAQKMAGLTVANFGKWCRRSGRKC